jgi:hypothetical protein
LGLDVVRILEAADESLKQQGASVSLEPAIPLINARERVIKSNGDGHGLDYFNGNGTSEASQHGKVAA